MPNTAKVPPEEAIRELKTRITAAQQRQARAQVERENAAAALERARAALVAEFEVTTPEQARLVLDGLEAELEAELATVRAVLADG